MRISPRLAAQLVFLVVCIFLLAGTVGPERPEFPLSESDFSQAKPP